MGIRLNPRPTVKMHKIAITEKIGVHAIEKAAAADRRREAERLYRRYVRDAMKERSYDPAKGAAGYAEGLIKWVTSFEKEAMRTRLQGEFREPRLLPVAVANFSVQAANRSLDVLGILYVLIHPASTTEGIFRYAEYVDGFEMEGPNEDLMSVQDLVYHVHLHALEELYDCMSRKENELIAWWTDRELKRNLRDIPEWYDAFRKSCG